MSKLPQISGSQLVRFFKSIGFHIVSQKGSHIKMTDGYRTVIIPNHKTIKKGTLRNGILKPMNISVDTLNTYLKK